MLLGMSACSELRDNPATRTRVNRTLRDGDVRQLQHWLAWDAQQDSERSRTDAPAQAAAADRRLHVRSPISDYA
jgi:hypothetical protein